MIKLGIIGDERVAHSLSPRMHNAVLGSLGLEGCYLPFAVSPRQIGAALEGVRALGLDGVNVTVPHKQAVIPYLDELFPEAEKLGAVNTILRQGDKLSGHNTDLGGFKAALLEIGRFPQSARALVFGAGGAARAVVPGLLELGARRVWLAARDQEQAAKLAGGPVETVSMEDAARLAGEAAVIINATSVSSPTESPEMASFLARIKLPSSCALIMDINYGREENFWADLAGRGGVYFQDGLAMLAAQAALCFELWTGRRVETARFRQALQDSATGQGERP